MEGMSWSDDTRCLFCEGRLPLYRKITHGQFCSSAHRKSYWQEQERLAIERLQQSNSSLRSYRSVEVQHEVRQDAVPYPDLEPSTQVIVASHSELKAHPELDPIRLLEANSDSIPEIDQPPMADWEFLGLLAPRFTALGGGSPELVAADPFEYEVALQPLPPSHSSSLGTAPLPEGLPVAVWSGLGLRPSVTKQAAGEASVEYEVRFCHPRSGQPTVRMRSAGSVELRHSRALEGRQPSAASNLQVLAMEPAPVTHVALKVSLQNELLLELLDEQMPQPDRLYPLKEFVARQSEQAFACPPPQQLDPAAKTALPTAAAVIVEHQLISSTGMLELSGAMPAAQGSVVSPTAISEIAIHPQTVTSAIPRVPESIHQMEIAGLQSLSLNLSHPERTFFATPVADRLAFDLSAGVSSDVTYPSLALMVVDIEAPLFDRLLPLTFARKRKVGGDATRVDPIVRALPQAVEIQPVIPNSGLDPLDRKPPQDAMREPQTAGGSRLRGEGFGKLEPVWAHATGFWHHAPRDLKLLLFAIPALLALVFHPGLPRIAFAAPKSSTGFSGGFTRAVSNEWTNVRTTLENRAAVALDEDFRSGLDNWASPEGSTTEWSFDSTGFVRPGPLALYRPSVNLTDYHMEFVGLIDKKALSWVVRARDFENFYVVKLEVLKSGPIPVIGLTRYAVIGGKSQDRHDVNIPLSARMDTLYNVKMDLQGSEFSVEVQGQIADSWTETRLPRGGVGFFTASGEASRLRWMQITHQYDMLGRLCAYLAPYDTTNGSWQP